MNPASCRVACLLVPVLGMFIACGTTERPTDPSPVVVTPPIPRLDIPSDGMPEPVGPSVTYVYRDQLSYPVSDYTVSSTLVLYENGAFALRYVIPRPGSYVGAYRREGDRLRLNFAAYEYGGLYEAEGLLGTGGRLELRFRFELGLSGFDDAVYVPGE